MKNHVASIQSKLKNIAQKDGKTYQLILVRYFVERLIYRLSISPFKHNFCLKGGTLLYAIEQEKSRPTMDIDFLGLNISHEKSRLTAIFKEIAQTVCESDGVEFAADSVKTEEIQKEGRYSGTRVKIDSHLGNIRQVLQIDIGFGDVITPHHINMTYPTLLSMPEPQIIAYSIESVIAEKFEAMIDLADQNSRMKDFYDVFKLLENHNYEGTTLKEAIVNTFHQRKTSYTENHILFADAFIENPNRLRMWQAFITKMNKNMVFEDIEFAQIIGVIKKHLQPIYENLRLEPPQ